MSKEVVEKPEAKRVKKKAAVKKKYKLIDFFGCLKGEFVYDDSVFNLGVRP